PHAPVYARCFALLGIADPGRVLAVGDSFRTDITGARAAGRGALLITGGIHRQDLAEAWGHSPDPARLAALSARYGVAPDAAIATFAW
ncbi:HAD hydrolase-like protein, partial [Streptomyces europaeiscabiei]|uniref:HAD hydrolase-like protein n=1 Tax=Streptomyces europaeiscabiei TaxID=146819 RepID=UPI0038F6D5FD